MREIPWSREKLWGPKPDAFLKASPRGEVPALTDGDLNLFDSTLIWQYLEAQYPDNPLAPSEPVQRAVCGMWEDQADHLMAKALVVLIQEVFMKPGGGGDAEAIGAALVEFDGFYSAMERRLDEADWLSDAFGIADIACFVCLAFAQTLGAPFAEGHPSVGRWFERMMQRLIVQSEFEGILMAAAGA